MAQSAWFLYALAAFILLGIGNFLLKYSTSRGIPVTEGIIIVWSAMGALGLAAIAMVLASGSKRLAVTTHNLWIPAAAGILIGLGIYCLKRAMILGKAGPATAVALSNAVLVALLAWLILGERLSRSEIVGMLLFMLALVIFALKPLG